ncbi:uncharacterized protein LOC119612660 [Lucilia sericata]|uniref:uncharacterized protein LOC119612660 n=1 Tax=Lucilia sericata TaxID=13632 RepID=UPI0018A87368|nr:uncharacterized protein LOC119612660 [Lucilia sericata]
MSVDRTPPPANIPPPLPLAPIYIEPSVCHVCTETMVEGDDCLIIHECSHAFHRSCIESHLSTSSECPVCKRACRLCDLRRLVINANAATFRPTIKKKGRGAMARTYNTRSTSNRNLFQESDPSNTGETSMSLGNEPENTQLATNDILLDTTGNNNNRINSPIQNPEHLIRTPSNNNNSSIDYDQINRLIEANITKLLQNMNIMQPVSNNNNQNNNNANTHQNGYGSQRPNTQTNVNIPYIFSPFANSNSNTGTIHADKVTSVIQNWNLKFDGSSNGLHVEEFLYRIKSLTRDTFNSDFTIICKNLHILLTGKARDWYWRYHKQVQSVNWDDFCDALRCQYRQYKSSFDIREEIRNRKQKPGESFDSFFDSVLVIMDRLPAPMSDSELIEILARNLRPDIRQDLLYVPIHSISHLRKLVQMREHFLNDESVRKNLFTRSQNQNMPRRYLSEIDSTNTSDNVHEVEELACSVDAVQGHEVVVKCWNCDESKCDKETLTDFKIPCYDNLSLVCNQTEKITLLERPKTYTNEPKLEISKLITPKLPYHERLQLYMQKRNEIFNLSEITECKPSKSKRSTVRLRKYYKMRKTCRKLLISAIVSNPKDLRYYAKVKFLNFDEYGLLDTGANISCLGSDLAEIDFSKFPCYTKCKHYVKTADGHLQSVCGWLDVEIFFKDQSKTLKLFIIPSISQRLILGIDFVKSFALFPDIVGSVDILTFNNSSNSSLFDLSVLSGKSEVQSDKTNQSKTPLDENSYPLSHSQRLQLNAVINLFPNFEKQGLGRTSLIRHSIDVGNASPIKSRFYPVSPAVEKLMYGELDRMLALGVIEPSTSPWSSPMRLVLKPNKVRLCLDARKVNAVTIKDAYPLPNIEGIFARLPKANLITKLDLKDAYWQIALDDKSKSLTAFTVPGRPLYQFVVMPFGLCNAPQTMCRLMDEIIPPDLRHCVFGYLDDLVIVSEDFETHLEILVRIASQFRKANLTLNISKSKFCVTSVNYLGFVIGNGGITTDPEKVQAIRDWPTPKNLKQIRGFLGLAGWYRRFIENFSTVVFPITELLSTKKVFKWTEEAQKAFENVKLLLTSAPVLTNPDFRKKFFLHCDASDFGIGAVLVQLDDQGQERPIAYMSKKLNSAQRNYSVTERECLAAMEAIKRFRCYLEMQEFEVITDHSSLLWLMRQPDLSGRLARWVFKLQSYNFSISHRKGKDNVVPDALSRIPVNEVAALEIIEPEIDLESPYFSDQEYLNLIQKYNENSAKYPDIKILDKYIYYRTEHYNGNENQEQLCWKLWVPVRLRRDTISRAHDTPVTAHGGMVKTLELLRRNFFWPGMVRDVRNYVRQCEICKTTKAPNFVMKPPMGNQSVSIRPFQRLYIDLLGPYPRSKSGYIGLLIVLCPLRKFTSNLIQEFLQKHIFHVYGVPEFIVSDNGSQFRANDFNAFLTVNGINHTYTALYSPQSNASERVNRSLIAGIRAFLKTDHRLWDEKLSEISCALRNSYHQSINTSPFYALFGFNMITHATSYNLLRQVKLLDEPSANIAHADNLQIVRENIRRSIKKAHDRNTHQYNLRSKPQSFQVGQEVFRRNFVQSNFEKRFNAKLSPLFIKARIRENVGNNYYILEDLQGKIIGTYHGKDIRP